MGFRGGSDDTVEWITMWKIDFKGETGDIGIDRNQTETFSHFITPPPVRSPALSTAFTQKQIPSNMAFDDRSVVQLGSG
jgi:hypothetical protein